MKDDRTVRTMLSPEEMEALKAIGKVQDRSMCGVIRQACRAYIIAHQTKGKNDDCTEQVQESPAL